ncbi:hypothetical protein [Lutibacter sp.]
MKKLVFLIFLVISTISCSGVKKTQEAINYGNYDLAIKKAIKQLQNNKTKKGNQPYILILEEAFTKLTEKSLEDIKFLKKDGNPANLEQIFKTYTNLDNKQELIKPLLPLTIQKKGRNAIFHFKDYTSNIIDAKNKLSHYLYTKASEALINSNNKLNFRNAYNDLEYLNSINPDYKDTHSLLEKAHFKGTNFVFVSIKNKTNVVIPMRLEEDLLNFDTYKLNDFWTVYHNNKQTQFNYDFELELSFQEINISPEQIREKIITQEKQLKDGWEYLIDKDGNAVKDSLGNTIKVDTFKTIKVSINKFTQFKSVQVTAKVNYYNLKTNQLIESFPIASEFIFEHHYANYSGNKNAIDADNLEDLKYKHIPFPSNEQMIYDSGEDLKKKIKHILKKNNFR